MTGPRCHRCHRAATHAVAVEGYAVTLCRTHAAELARRLADEPRVEVGGRVLHVEPPALDARGRR